MKQHHLSDKQGLQSFVFLLPTSLTITTEIPMSLVAQEYSFVDLSSALSNWPVTHSRSYNLVQLLHMRALQELT